MRSLLLASLLLAIPLAGCTDGVDAPGQPPDERPRLPGAVITTPQGSITVVLYPDLAPETVRQFTELTATGWYNGSVFHRTVDNFVIQGGAPPEGRDEADTIPLEPGGYFSSGSLGIARTEDPDSGTSQFFLSEYPQPHLRDPDLLQSPTGYTYGSFTMFGQVIDGMDVVRTINDLPHDDSGTDRPRDPPPMEVAYRLIPVEPALLEELPYRTWGRQLAPPYRVSLESPGTLVAGEPTWLRLFTESQVDRGAQTGLTPTVVVSGPGGEPVADVGIEPHPEDGNVHTVRLVFPTAGVYSVQVFDGVRPLVTFQVSVG